MSAGREGRAEAPGSFFQQFETQQAAGGDAIGPGSLPALPPPHPDGEAPLVPRRPYSIRWWARSSRRTPRILTPTAHSPSSSTGFNLEQVRTAKPAKAEDAIRCGGLAEVKVSRSR